MKNAYKEIALTNHFFQRAYERLHLNDFLAYNFAVEAYYYGNTIEDFCGKQREFLERMQNSRDPWHTVLRVYKGNLLIFDDTGLGLTVYPLNTMGFFRSRKTSSSVSRSNADASADAIIFVYIDLFIEIRFVLFRKVILN